MWDGKWAAATPPLPSSPPLGLNVNLIYLSHLRVWESLNSSLLSRNGSRPTELNRKDRFKQSKKCSKTLNTLFYLFFLKDSLINPSCLGTIKGSILCLLQWVARRGDEIYFLLNSCLLLLLLGAARWIKRGESGAMNAIVLQKRKKRPTFFSLSLALKGARACLMEGPLSCRKVGKRRRGKK